MKIINQKEYNKGDCGIACISTITQINYSIIKSAFIEEKIFTKNGPFYTKHSDIIKILSKFGYSTKRKLFKSWKDIEGTAIVKINTSQNGYYWHWVILHKEHKNSKGIILDPKPQFKESITHFRGRRGSGQYILIS